MRDGKDVLILILGVVLLISLFKIRSNADEYELYRDAAERKHREAVRSLEQQLLDSRESRDSAILVIDSLDRSGKALRRADSLEIVELSRIPGKFNNKNSEELQKEMIKQYAKTQQR